MAIEALVGYTLGVVFIVGLGLYMNRHRVEDEKKGLGENHRQA